MIDPQDHPSQQVQSKIKIKNPNKINITQTDIEVIDDVTKLNVGGSSYTLFTNNNLPLAVGAIGTNLQIYARQGSLILNLDTGILSVTLANGSVITVGNVVANATDPFRFRPNTGVIKVDSKILNVANANDIERFISNTTNMRANIRAVGSTENEFLPLWMRTAQSGQTQVLGYVTAVPLCYCQPGTSAKILAALKNNGFDFKNIDFEIDRYIIDSTTDSGVEQYIMFPSYQYNI